MDDVETAKALDDCGYPQFEESWLLRQRMVFRRGSHYRLADRLRQETGSLSYTTNGSTSDPFLPAWVKTYTQGLGYSRLNVIIIA